MEQKQLDDLEETYFGEEFIDDEEDVRVEDLKEKKKVPVMTKPNAPVAPTSSAVAAAKRAASKASIKTESRMDSKVETKATSALPRDEEGYVVLEDRKTDIKESKVESRVEAAKPKKVVETASSNNPWAAKDNSSSSSSSSSSNSSASSSLMWKIIAGVLLIALIAAILTSGFRGLAPAGASLTMGQAEEKALNYVNANLLEPPFTAQVESSQDEGSVYRVTLSIGAQKVDSYITKDGELFFPQGFPTDATTPTTPGSQLVEVDIEDQPTKGNANAPITIVEFSDFECPFCGQFYEETLTQLDNEYIKTGKARLVFRDFPLSFHPQAQPAALAAACADEQGKFWEYHNLLFERQDALSAENYLTWAEELSLDADKFQACFETKKYLDEVQRDLADGQEYGVSGTPAFFINGKLLSGAQPFSAFKQEIDAQLAAIQQPAQPTVDEEPSPAVPLNPAVEQEPAVPTQPQAQAQTQSVSITSKKWSFTPNLIRVKEGTRVSLTIVPDEREPTFSLPTYTFSIPEFGVSEEVGGRTTVEFVADKKGQFAFSCSSCPPQRNMKGTLIVE